MSQKNDNVGIKKRISKKVKLSMLQSPEGQSGSRIQSPPLSRCSIFSNVDGNRLFTEFENTLQRQLSDTDSGGEGTQLDTWGVEKLTEFIESLKIPLSLVGAVFGVIKKYKDLNL